MGSSMTCKNNPCCGNRINCDPPEQFGARNVREKLSYAAKQRLDKFGAPIIPPPPPATNSFNAGLEAAAEWHEQRIRSIHIGIASGSVDDYATAMSAIGFHHYAATEIRMKKSGY